MKATQVTAPPEESGEVIKVYSLRMSAPIRATVEKIRIERGERELKPIVEEAILSHFRKDIPKEFRNHPDVLKHFPK